MGAVPCGVASCFSLAVFSTSLSLTEPGCSSVIKAYLVFVHVLEKWSSSLSIEDAEASALCCSLFQQLIAVIHSKCNVSSPFPWLQLPTTGFCYLLHWASPRFKERHCLLLTVLLHVNPKCLTSVWEGSDLFEAFTASLPDLKYNKKE